MLETAFPTIALVLALTAVLAAVAHLLRQPLVMAFIVAGVLVGPAGLGLVSGRDGLELLARIGVALLLFVVGLRLDPELVRALGPVALLTGLGQVVVTAVLGYGIALLLGLPPLEAVYVAVALTLSSTIIIVKLLSDKHEIDSLHGRIVLGVLIVQDMLVIVVMLVLNAVAHASTSPALQLSLVLVRGLAFVAVLVLLARLVLPSLAHWMARSPEMLTLFAITWAVALAAIAEGIGVSKEIGAFLAGVALASTNYREAIASRLVTLRDFLLLFFFIDLGTRIDVGMLGQQVGPAAVLSLFVLVGNPVVVMAVMGSLGYRRRTSLLAGVTMAQISEFSLILMALGLTLGHVRESTLGLVTLVGIVTIALSTYLIQYSHELYEFLGPALGVFERDFPYRENEQQLSGPAHTDVVVIGLGRYGWNLGMALKERGMSLLGVDFDPEAVRRWRDRVAPAEYGDADDPDLPASLPLRCTRLVVNTVSDLHISTVLLQSLRANGYTGPVALTAHSRREAELLRERGADITLLPFEYAARSIADGLVHAMEASPLGPECRIVPESGSGERRSGSRDGGRRKGKLHGGAGDDLVQPITEAEAHRRGRRRSRGDA